jgi:hypothetical protein
LAATTDLIQGAADVANEAQRLDLLIKTTQGPAATARGAQRDLDRRADKTREGSTMMRSVMIDGTEFDVSAQEQSDGGWHWLITAPGRLVLSGDAPNETHALLSAVDAGEALRVVSAMWPPLGRPLSVGE